MARKVRKIDPKLGLGLHELARSMERRGWFSFQLKFAEQQIEDILLNLDGLVRNTIDKAPCRRKDFRLDRPPTRGPLTHEEDKWEQAIYEKWGPRGSGEYVPVCSRVQTYQYPLRNSLQDGRWGEIDLLGIGLSLLPVPIELKKSDSKDSPLRMLVEVAAYGFALQKVWPNLKVEWVEAMRSSDGSPPPFPARLDRVTLVCTAPEEYWLRFLGRWPNVKEGQFLSGAWPPFWQLVNALGRWFDIHFVAVEGVWNNEGLPAITGARLLDLRADSGQ